MSNIFVQLSYPGKNISFPLYLPYTSEEFLNMSYKEKEELYSNIFGIVHKLHGVLLKQNYDTGTPYIYIMSTETGEPEIIKTPKKFIVTADVLVRHTIKFEIEVDSNATDYEEAVNNALWNIDDDLLDLLDRPLIYHDEDRDLDIIDIEEIK